MTPYETHLPVIDAIFKITPIHNVFEFGCGLYSTKYFVDNCDKVESVEMQSEQWYNKIKKEIVSDKIKLSLLLGDNDAITYFDSLNTTFDMVFIDGLARPACIKHAISKTNIIVIHDTNLKSIRMFRGTVFPSKWYFYNSLKNKPFTGIYTNLEILRKLKDII